MKTKSIWLAMTLNSLIAIISSSCGSSTNGSSQSPGTESVFDSDAGVLDGTGITADSKAALTEAIGGSSLLADFALGRLFDFELQRSFTGIRPAKSDEPVFCEGELPLVDTAVISGERLEIQYEADVTACSNKSPSDDVGSIKVDRSRVGFALTFACSTKDVTKLAEAGSARAVLAIPDALVCRTSRLGATTGRAYRYAAVVDGRYVGPRSEVPIRQKFWRGYHSGGTGEPCLLARSALSEERLGLCRFYERSESENFVDQSRSIKLLTAEALPRTRNGSLFDDGSLRMSFNGWTANTNLSPEDNEITLDFSGPGAQCARFSVRPGLVHFSAADCLLTTNTP